MKTIGLTHIGLVREINEDSYFMSEDAVGRLPNLFIVADGMGGHKAGEIASKLAVEAFVNYCKKQSCDETIEEIFIKANDYANNVIYEKSLHKDELSGMGTTLVACSLVEDTLYISNIGDSRLYIVEKGLKQVTVDHSYVEELVRAGKISRDESITHPNRNKITRALGITHEIEVDIFKLSLKGILKIILCSDGLTSMVRDEKIFEILNSNATLFEQGEKLINESIKSGGTDNITLLIIDINN